MSQSRRFPKWTAYPLSVPLLRLQLTRIPVEPFSVPRASISDSSPTSFPCTELAERCWNPDRISFGAWCRSAMSALKLSPLWCSDLPHPRSCNVDEPGVYNMSLSHISRFLGTMRGLAVSQVVGDISLLFFSISRCWLMFPPNPFACVHLWLVRLPGCKDSDNFYWRDPRSYQTLTFPMCVVSLRTSMGSLGRGSIR